MNMSYVKTPNPPQKICTTLGTEDENKQFIHYNKLNKQYNLKKNKCPTVYKKNITNMWHTI